MSGYLPNIPTAVQLQSVSQGQILTNFGVLNSSYGIDHYDYTVSGANTGFHNKVTTPAIIGGVPVTTTNPIFYAYQPTANVGLLQFSGGASAAVPTPLTNMQSPVNPITLAPSGASDVLNFSGLARAYGTLFIFDTVNGASQVAFVFWSGSGSPLVSNELAGNLIGFANGTFLTVKNTFPSTTLNNVYWTFNLARLS